MRVATYQHSEGVVTQDKGQFEPAATGKELARELPAKSAGELRPPFATLSHEDFTLAIAGLSQSMAASESQIHLVSAKASNAVEMLPPAPAGRSARTEQEVLLELRERIEETLETASPQMIQCLCEGLIDILAYLGGGQARSRVKPKRSQQQKARAATTVLLADNDPTVTALLSSTLSNHEMHCATAVTGGEVLKLLRRERPEVLVLSVNLEELDGFQVLSEIKRDPFLRSIKVIMLTSRRTEVDVVRAFGLGADDYVTKPFSPMELAMRIRRLVGRIE